VLGRCPEFQAASESIRSFAGMLTELTGRDLPRWISETRAADLPGISGFARGLEQDLDAVTQGLTTQWNSGRPEGRRQPHQDDQAADVRPRPAFPSCASASCSPPRPLTRQTGGRVRHEMWARSQIPNRTARDTRRWWSRRSSRSRWPRPSRRSGADGDEPAVRGADFADMLGGELAADLLGDIAEKDRGQGPRRDERGEE
jgi:hypothetical protein